jgi:hypothetical protein
MKHVIKIFGTVVIILVIYTNGFPGGNTGDLGFGLRLGLNRLEGDIRKPALRPLVYGNLTYNANYFIGVGIESGFSTIADYDRKDFQTLLIPFELHATLNFFPLSRINPYALLGGGGVYWNATTNNKTVRYPSDTGVLQKGIDSFIKVGGGLEFALNQSRKLYLNVGATYRYSFTDMFDVFPIGDENDGVVDVHVGLNYFFKTAAKGDKDDDGIPDNLDLDNTQKEDNDGYMDHDGKPDGIPPLGGVWNKMTEIDTSEDVNPPVVIHLPIRRAEQGHDIKIKAEIFENKKLKVASVIYRPVGIDNWKALKLKNLAPGISYEGIIPGEFVKKQGLEYCVLAVDEAVSGIGYSGLPKRPIRVKVIGHPTGWRLINSTMAVIGWGTAGYIIYRKQK